MSSTQSSNKYRKLRPLRTSRGRLVVHFQNHLREAGAKDIRVKIQVGVVNPGECAHAHLLSRLDVLHEKVLNSGVLNEVQISEHRAALIDRLNNPDTLLNDKLLIEKARSALDWRKEKDFVADLEATVDPITGELAARDPSPAMERLIRFLGAYARVCPSVSTIRAAGSRMPIGEPPGMSPS